MDGQVIERTLEKRSLSKTGLARALGIRNSGVTDLIQGKRNLKAAELPIVRKYLGLDTVPLKGYVGAGGQAEFWPLPEDELNRVPAPEDASDLTVAVEIRGDSLGPPLNGWLVYYDAVERPITRSLYNQLCVVGLSDGRVLIKKVVPSKIKGLFHLVPSVGETIMDVPIEWAAKVLRMQPR